MILRKAKTMNTWKTVEWRNAGRVLGCNAAAYIMNVMRAHTSLGSHPQYCPHDTLANIAPTNMPMPRADMAGYRNRSESFCRASNMLRALLFTQRTMMAVTPLINVSDSRAKPIIIIDTWMLSSGELSTGMTWLICGSIWPMWLTSRKKPDMRNPHVIRMRNFRLSTSDTSNTVHATKSMVS